jgi:periplasmic copper chaperone A
MNAHFLFRALLLFLSLPATVQAAATATAGLEFEQAWIRSAPAASPVMAGYVRIVNPGTRTVRIVAMRSPQFARVEAHTMREVDGVMRMRPLVLELSPGETLELAPGGHHLMLMQPAATLAEGTRATLEFTLDDGRRRAVEFEVRAATP